MVAASVGACCVETAFFGCALCSGAGAMAGMAGNEALGGYCD
ncbi:hypothetical protein DB30_00065 [Enhygromyxa salina]|uniref:Uncharacterized protein n=2 Tax=Enhygromyxa salina TaxID=215803 RepID=A0A0C2D912_9BACT|nr:hypothetical protein DB30_00065 [Enhygromyxa salina]